MSTAAFTATQADAGGRRRPGVVAMVGAGQLARMTHQAAIGLDVRLRVLAAAADDAAVLSGAAHLVGSPERLEDLRALAEGAEVLTFDHERVPPEHLAALEADGVRLAPSASAKLFAQDKLHQRRELSALGLPVPPFVDARATGDASRLARAHGWPLVAKAPRGGYDGRGVFEVGDPGALQRALAAHPDGLLLEPRLDLERELAIIVARSADGSRVAYPVVETVQRDAMCREIVAPAQIPAPLAAQARELALELAAAIDATGVLAVELFHTTDGRLLVNELALRPHNSGHYTIEGCVTSQFEQHLRAVLGLPLGLTDLRAPAVVTVNVVGPADGSDPAARIGDALAVPGAHVHLYGKRARAGRKLGHVTVCGSEPAATRNCARRAAALLEGSQP
ncbi:MAG TPA: 5-(carboxyamino)imidazole ribonucleotide synthase [Solirubrobacteraceae bacterium]|nr:5-(carboxyamino)imidazole ribonucleotide synthase [Solirubrobacteraceae bacterium]